MSNPHLPSEMLDHIVGHLHDAEDALRNCCLVSKSWIPRTRKYLFADVKFPTEERLRSWEETFPDPSTSPAHYTKTLLVGCPRVSTAADVEASSWIRGFSRVVHLEVGRQGSFASGLSSLTPFHGFSLFIKSLRMTFAVPTSLRLINFIVSFPLLEDLAVVASYSPLIRQGDYSEGNGVPTAPQPSCPPMLTGSLELYLKGGMEPFARRLLSLPGGIHFRELNLTCHRDGDPLMVMALVEACSHTLESLKISDLYRTSVQHLRPRW
jgi:hypothetical protein